MKIHLAIKLACLGVVTAIPLSTLGQDDSVTGTWAWTHKGESKKTDCEFSISGKDGNYVATLQIGKKILRSKDAKISGGEVNVNFQSSNNKEYQFVGKPGDKEIKGTYRVPSTGDKDWEWAAKRTVGLDDIVGRWQLSFETPDGEVLEPSFSIKNNEGKPEIEFFATGPELEVTEIGLKKGVLTVVGDVEYQGEELEVEYEMRFKNDEISGIVFYLFKSNGQEGDLELEGGRIDD